MTDVHSLARSGDDQALRTLLDCGDLAKAREIAGQKDSHSRTPLHLAAFFGHSQAVEVLLKYSDIDAAAMDGFTALHFAAQKGHTEVTKLLVKQSNIDRKTYKSQTPLHLACAKATPGSSYEGVIQELILRGCDTSVKSKQGKTPIELIADGGLKQQAEQWIIDRKNKKHRSRADSEHEGASPKKHHGLPADEVDHVS